MGVWSGGVPIVERPGAHAVYIDARAFCPETPPPSFPGQTIVCGLYRHAGIHAVEIGSLMFGSDDRPAEMELVRTAIPRRAYTQSHVDYVAEAVLEVFDRRDTLKPLRMCEAPQQLRHFTARLAEMNLQPSRRRVMDRRGTFVRENS